MRKNKYLEYPNNLVEAICRRMKHYESLNVDWEASEENVKALEWAIERFLSEKQEKYLLAYFKDNKSYVEIAKEAGCTRSNVNDIVRRAVSKLGVKRFRYDYLKEGIPRENEAPAEASKEKNYDNIDLGEINSIQIEELRLSSRVFNLLRRAGTQTIGELIGKFENNAEGFKKIRQFGKVAFKEVASTIDALYNTDYYSTSFSWDEKENNSLER